MRKILLIGTGGTIACGHSDDGLKPLLTPEQLLSYVQDSKEYKQRTKALACYGSLH